MSDLQTLALDKFFKYYRDDIASEVLDSNNVVLSFPVHYSGFHRIEVTVTRLPSNSFIISDGAKVLEELRVAGYPINARLKARLEEISRAASLRIVNNHLVSDCSLDTLGSSLQRFVEAAKSIGDAYLVQRATPTPNGDLIGIVSSFLLEQRVPFKTKQSLMGQYEQHVVDFYFPPNGVPGLALSIMNNPNRTTAEAWAFRAQDIKKTNARMQVGVVYDDAEIRKNSQSLLNGVLDVSIPSSDLSALGGSLRNIGILKQ